MLLLFGATIFLLHLCLELLFLGALGSEVATVHITLALALEHPFNHVLDAARGFLFLDLGPLLHNDIFEFDT